MKLWIKHRKTMVMNKCRIRFLKFCIEHNIVPQHLYRIQCHSINVTHYRSIKRYNNLKKYMVLKILKLELNEAFRTLHNSRRQVLHLGRQIASQVPGYIVNTFFYKQDKFLEEFYRKEENKLDKKMSWLIVKQNRELIDHINKTGQILLLL